MTKESPLIQRTAQEIEDKGKIQGKSEEEIREDIDRTCMVFTIAHLEIDNVELQRENELLATANQALAATIAYYESRS